MSVPLPPPNADSDVVALYDHVTNFVALCKALEARHKAERAYRMATFSATVGVIQTGLCLGVSTVSGGFVAIAVTSALALLQVGITLAWLVYARRQLALT